MTHKFKTNSQSGNILIYILGAIFLLGLLVVISKGSVTPGAGIDQETLMIRVAEVQAYGQELERAVGYVMANGHSEVDIRFAHPDASSDYGAITDIPSRQIFSREGGGATYRVPPEGIQTVVTPWLFNGRNKVLGVGSSINSNTSDLIAILSYVTKDFCVAINKKSNVENPGGNPPKDGATAQITTPFQGVYQFSHNINDIASLFIFGKLEACFEGGGPPPTGTYHYYRVLLAR